MRLRRGLEVLVAAGLLASWSGLAPAQEAVPEESAPAEESAVEGAGDDAAATADASEATAEGEAPTQVAAATAPVVEPKSLEEILDLLKVDVGEEREGNQAREHRFKEAMQLQGSLLGKAQGRERREQARSERLEQRFDTNEKHIEQLGKKLIQREGQLGELFGVVRQVAGDMQGHAWDSVTSSYLGNRKPLLEKLGRGELPSTEDLEQLWFELHREMTEQGKVMRYSTPVLSARGVEPVVEDEREVTRAGVFTVVSNGEYLQWDPEVQKFRELERQPPARYVNTIGSYESTPPDSFGMLAVDPARGSLLIALTDEPSTWERVKQGGAVGYVIISLGILAGAIGFWRLAAVTHESRKVAAQRSRDKPDQGNPLGRVRGVFEANRATDPETLELRLDEAVLRESAELEKLVWLVKVASVVAPLLGLLGTVTGMIQTFQAITLYGAGDPKMMAGGISQALVTTMLGLIVAIPLVLLHAAIANNVKHVVEELDEESTGLIAVRAEEAAHG